MLPDRSSPPRRRDLLRAVRLLLAAASLGLFARVVASGSEGFAGAWAALRSQRPTSVVLMLVLVGAWIVALAQVQRRSARALGVALGVGDALRISRGAFTLSRIVPGGGAAGGVFAMREFARLGHRPGVASAIMVVSWGVTSVTCALVIVTASAVALTAGLLPLGAVLPALAVLLALAAAGAMVLRAVGDDRLRTRLIGRVQPSPRGEDRGGPAARVVGIRRRVVHALHDLDGLDAEPSALRVAVGWSGLVYLLEIALLWSVFAAVGAPVSAGLVAAGFVSASLLNSVPELTPGWIGVYETTMVAAYVGLGVSLETAVVAVLLHRFVTFWLPVGVGVVPAVRSLSAGRGRTATDLEVAA